MWETFNIQNIWLKWAIRIIIIAHFGAFSCSGCNDANVNVNVQGDCMNLRGQSTGQTECCDANGVAISPPPTGCPGPESGSIGGDALDPGAEAVSVTAEALDSASALIGGDTSSDVGSDPSLLAATAGPSSNGNSAISPNSERRGDPNLSIPEAGLNTGRTNRGGGSAPNSGSLGGLKKVKGTLPSYSNDEALSEAQKSLEGDTQLAAYGGGGGGAARPTNKGFGGIFNSTSSGLNAAQVSGINTKEQNFDGSERDLAGISGEAPEDYLARISQFADIFKVIATRYRKTSMDWALKDSERQADRANAVSSPQSKRNAASSGMMKKSVN